MHTTDMSKVTFSWSSYLQENDYAAVPFELFSDVYTMS